MNFKSIFKFQYGAIKSSGTGFVSVANSGFQFQYGAIERVMLHKQQVSRWNFNSSMVRLRVGVLSLAPKADCISIPVWCD